MGGAFVTQTTLANQALQVTCQSEVVQDSSVGGHFQAWLWRERGVSGFVCSAVSAGTWAGNMKKLENHDVVSFGLSLDWEKRPV